MKLYYKIISSHLYQIKTKNAFPIQVILIESDLSLQLIILHDLTISLNYDNIIANLSKIIRVYNEKSMTLVRLNLPLRMLLSLLLTI